MFLYHGDTEIVTEPEIQRDDNYLNFDIGFYTTSSIEHAEHCARNKMQMDNVRFGYVTIYEFDAEKAEKELSVKKFDTIDEEWMTFVINNNKRNIAGNEFDMYIGPVIDENVYEFIRLFKAGVYDIEYIIEKLRAKVHYEQLTLHSVKALEYLSFFGVKKLDRRFF